MNFLRSVLICFLLFCAVQLGVAQIANPWTFETSPRQKEVLQKKSFKKARTLSLNKEMLEKVLFAAPLRFSKEAAEETVILTVPLPNGEFADYKIVEAPVLHPDLGKKFPAIKSYAGQGITDPTAYLRFAWSPHGFHAVILSGTQETIIIDTEDKENRINHYVYYRKDRIPTQDFPFSCTVQRKEKKGPLTDLFAEQRSAGDCQLRTYRLALACTGEYVRFHGGTTADALAAMNTTMTRVNGVFERDLAVTMEIIPNNTELIFLRATSDPYSNNSGPRMLDQNQSTVDNIIGSANYDIGHVFSTGGGGVAGLGVVCDLNDKAAGVTGFPEPIGDQFDLDFVAHEMGHQFGAEHTFSGNEGSCAGNNEVSSAVEPGSGSTIMGYAQLCESENVQLFSDAYFHARSLLEITTFLLSASNRCAQLTDLNNEPPRVEAGASYRIPKSTPFVLTGTATDADNAELTYCWEQMDRSTTQPQPPMASNRSGPVFRSFSPSSSPQRYFPRLVDIVENRNPTWEVLSSANRNLAFRLTVRDNNIGGGCTEEDNMTVTVNADAGPFVVSHPNTSTVSWRGNTKETVSWEVANTDAAPISAREVDIYLSTDGGYTYPELLLAGAPNTGAVEIVVPNLPTNQARIMVKGAGNIFFDISNRNFSILETLNDFVTSVSPPSQAICAEENAVFDISIEVSGELDGAVVLTTLGLPNSFTASFSNNNFIPPNSSRLTIQSNGSVSEGTYPFTLNIAGSTGVQTRDLSISVVDGVPNIVALKEPSNNAIGVSVMPTFIWAPVNGANEYILQVATTPNFSSLLLEETVTTTEFTLPTALDLSARYYWKVMPKSVCFGSDEGTAYSFITAELACEIFEPTDLPQNISPIGMPRVGSFINVPISGTVTDVNILNLDIDHDWVADLLIGVISPAETAAALVGEGLCFASPNLNLNFDDESANVYNSIPCPPTNRETYVPLSPLSVFNGEQMEGDWALLILDEVEDDGGRFNNWALEVCYLGKPKVLPLAISLEKTDETCPASQDGQISVSAIDGLGNYNYNWSNGATTATIDNLIPATYTVTVSDGSTTLEESITINPATSIEITPIVDAPSCFGVKDGIVEIRSNEVLTYSWNTGAATSRLDGIGGGIYTVTLTNALNCKSSNTISIPEPSKIINTLTPKQITCAGGLDGAVSLSISDNTNPSFQWSNDAITQDINNVSAGIYSVTVTDNSCQETMEVVLREPAPISVVAVATTPSCKGGADAQLNAEGRDGVAPYSYIWNTGVTTNVVTTITAGTYQVTVTDANGCSNAAEVIAAESTNAISVNLEVKAASCEGLSNGQVTAEVMDGLLPYNYLWSDGSDTEMLDSISEGAYRVTVTDANACSNIAEVQINAPTPISIDFEIIDASCFGLSDGQIVADIRGGSGEYTYLWNDGRTIKSLLNVPTGNYSVTVTDANNCEATAEMLVSQNADIDLRVSPVMISCNGAADGQILTQVDAAKGPYTYNWSNGSTAESIGNLPSGTYTLTITAANACEKVVPVELTEPTPLILNGTITPISCNGLSDGKITLEVIGGRKPLSYQWNNGDFLDIENGLSSGNYGLTITDAAGCTASKVFTLEEPPVIDARFVTTAISDKDSTDGQIITSVQGGTDTYTFAWDTGDATANLTNVEAGTYILTVTDANACSRAFAAVIQGVECFNLSLDLSATKPLCSDMPDGMISAETNGGTVPYNYEWSTGDTTSQIANLLSGQYALTITDALGCSLSDTENLQATSNIQLSLASKTDYSCQNQVTGSAIVEATDGWGDYTYIWPNGATTTEVFNLEPDNYTVIVRDELSCAATLEVAILSTDIIRTPVFKEAIIAYVNEAGNVSLAPEMLLALPIDSCSIQALEFSNLQFDCEDIGENTITVTTTFIGDSTAMQTLNIEIRDTIKPILRCPADILISACVDTVYYELERGADNCGLVFYIIPEGLESGSVFPEGTTTVTHTAIDNIGNLLATCDFQVEKETKLSVEVSLDNILAYEIDREGVYVITSIADCISPDLSTFFVVQGGTEPYESDIELIADNLTFKRYAVRIIDANGCTIEETVVVPVPSEEGNFVLNSEITPASTGAKDGSIELEVADDLALLFEWYRGDTLLSKDKDIFELSAGTYTLVIEDMFGCKMVDSFTVDMLVSANEIYLDYQIDLFPNPTKGAINIEFDLDKRQAVEVLLYDVSGRLVLSPILRYHTQKERISIDLNTLAKGIYLAKIKVEEGILFKKIVLN